MPQNPHVLLTFDKVHKPLRLPREATSERPKVLRTLQFFALLTWKCASRHNGVHFFGISTSKSGPNPLTFGLRNVLRATTACTFSTSQLPKVVRTWCVLCILTSKCASRHNGVHFFDISTSKSAPRPKCFVHFDFEMCFAPQRRAIFHLSSGQLAPHPPLYPAYFSTLRSPKSLEKHSFSRLSYLFAHLHLLSSDSFSSTLLSSNLSLLSASALSSVHIVGSLTSKLPSTTTTTTTIHYVTLQLQLQLQLQLH